MNQKDSSLHNQPLLTLLILKFQLRPSQKGIYKTLNGTIQKIISVFQNFNYLALFDKKAKVFFLKKHDFIAGRIDTRNQILPLKISLEWKAGTQGKFLLGFGAVPTLQNAEFANQGGTIILREHMQNRIDGHDFALKFRILAMDDIQGKLSVSYNGVKIMKIDTKKFELKEKLDISKILRFRPLKIKNKRSNVHLNKSSNIHKNRITSDTLDVPKPKHKKNILALNSQLAAIYNQEFKKTIFKKHLQITQRRIDKAMKRRNKVQSEKRLEVLDKLDKFQKLRDQNAILVDNSLKFFLAQAIKSTWIIKLEFILIFYNLKVHIRRKRKAAFNLSVLHLRATVISTFMKQLLPHNFFKRREKLLMLNEGCDQEYLSPSQKDKAYEEGCKDWINLHPRDLSISKRFVYMV